ncbi:MAG: hypothetical protein AMXMBFR47_38130 [Planctomycetota bacterium]
MRTNLVGVFAALLLSAAPPVAAQTPCEPDWCAVGGPFSEEAILFSLAVFNAGDGPKLYAGGEFYEVEGRPARNLAAWDGRRWTPVDSDANRRVTMLKVIDEETGPVLYVGGSSYSAEEGTTVFFAKFDGVSWTPIPGLLRDPGWFTSGVYDVAWFDSGGGPELYVGGWFTIAGNPPGGRAIARLTASGFEPLGTGLTPIPGYTLGVGALQVFDDGLGAALYVGGSFLDAGGHRVRNVARWDGRNWSPVGAGLPESYPIVYAPTVSSLVPWSDEDGPVLLACGDIVVGARQGIAGWRGTQWIADYGHFLPDGVIRLRAVDLGEGPTLVASGRFTSVDGQPAPFLARRQGDAWEPIGFGLLRTDTVALESVAFDDGRGPALFVGGRRFGHTEWPSAQVPIGRFGVVRADLDCDGAVSITDLTILLSAFEESDGGDLDSDGQTTLEDLAILLSKFGNECGE